MAGLDIPFADHLGFVLASMEGGRAEITLDPPEHLLNSWQVVHGGVTMTLLDVTMAHAARSLHLHQADAPGLVTVEMKTSFLRPAEGALRCTGAVLHRSSTMAFTEGSVFNVKGELCAHATGTFKFLRALPAGGRALTQRVKPTSSTTQGN